MKTYPFDTLRDTFLRLLADGMTHEEALMAFDEEEFWQAAMAEFFSGAVRVVPALENIEKVGDWITNDERKLPALFDLLTTARMEHRNSVNGDDYKQAMDLWQSGWTSESQRPDSQVMSWYWRAPPKRPGKPGRKFLSTNQAWNAMRRAIPTD